MPDVDHGFWRQRQVALGERLPETLGADDRDSLTVVREHADDVPVAAVQQVPRRAARGIASVDGDRRVLVGVDDLVQQHDGRVRGRKRVEVREFGRLRRARDQNAVDREVEAELRQFALLHDGIIALEEQQRIVVLAQHVVDPAHERRHEEHIHLRHDQRHQPRVLRAQVPRTQVGDVIECFRRFAHPCLRLRPDVRVVRQRPRDGRGRDVQ